MSFTIRCDKCGKEQKLVTKEYFDYENIQVYAECSHEPVTSNIVIVCDCGNEICDLHS